MLIESSPPDFAVLILIAFLLIILYFGANMSSSTSSSASSSSPDDNSIRPTDLHSKTPEEFEGLVAEAWESQDYDTEHLDRRDTIDILATTDDDSVAIEAKRYKPGNKISSPAVQQVLADAMETDADRAAIATSSSFTGPAKEKAEDRNIELVNGDRLCKWLS